ncbi:MAG: hypothetical protein U9N04_04475 [Patescibacteria group bacterium]|nr:hypothetical protein [Patescibacteria group bacterium]
MAKILLFKHLRKKRNKAKKKTVSCLIKESKLTLGFFVVILVCVMGSVYMSGINNVATKGYEVENYEKRLSELKKEKQKMMVELADLKSIQDLDNQDSRFVAINQKDIAYLTSISSAVAMK